MNPNDTTLSKSLHRIWLTTLIIMSQSCSPLIINLLLPGFWGLNQLETRIVLKRSLNILVWVPMQMALTGHEDRWGLKIGVNKCEARVETVSSQRLAGTRPSNRPKGWQWTCPATKEKDNNKAFRSKFWCKAYSSIKKRMCCRIMQWICHRQSLSHHPSTAVPGSSIKLHHHYCSTLWTVIVIVTTLSATVEILCFCSHV